MSAPGTTADAGAAGKLPRHLALVTLGVADVATSRAFYEALGLEAAGFESADIAFFDMNGTVLALFGREALAADAQRAAQAGRSPSSVENSVRHLFDHVAPQYRDRPGGYAQIVRLGLRPGDGATRVRLRLVDYRPPE